MKDTHFHWIARHLPRRLRYWCAVDVIAHATAGRHIDQTVPELTAMEALERWDETRKNVQIGQATRDTDGWRFFPL